MMKPIIATGCMDCDETDSFETITKARAAIVAHQLQEPEHRQLVSDHNGWHRYWLGGDGGGVIEAVGFKRPES